MKNSSNQWKNRLEVINVIYKDILENYSSNIKKTILDLFEKQKLTVDQLKIVEYYFANCELLQDVLSQNLAANWTVERINALTKAIIFCSICESKTLMTDKAIIIDQALITCKNRGNIKDKNFINAVLDKIIKNKDDKK